MDKENINKPSWEVFLAAPAEDIAEIVPQTMVFEVGGTRRQAALQGIDSHSDKYAQYSWQQMITCLEMIFQHGVQHIVMPLLGPTNFSEVGVYQEKLVRWVTQGLASDRALETFKSLGWRVYLQTDETIPMLQKTAEQLRVANNSISRGKSVWMYVIPDHNLPWQWFIKAIQLGATTREEVVRSIFREEVPLAEIYVGNGKPKIYHEVFPILVNKIAAYWTQNLGYTLTAKQFREILYDYKYTRNTWKADKKDRAEAVLRFREYWEGEDLPILGLGTRIGPFWYPKIEND